MSLRGCAGGSIAAFLCSAAGLMAGGVVGYYAGLDQAAHEGSAGWWDLRGLYAPFDALIGGVIGAAIGAGVAMIARLIDQAQAAIVTAFVIISGVIGFATPKRYQDAQDQSTLQSLRAAQADSAARARQQANYGSLNANLATLQYPGSRLQPQQPGNPLSMTSSDAPQAVADYYQRLLGVPLTASACTIGPGNQCWDTDASYQGTPLHITITSDDLNDGGKSAVLISTSDQASSPPISSSAIASAPPSSPQTAPPVSATPAPAAAPADAVTQGQAVFLDAQRAKIVRLRAELPTLGYSGAKETSDGDPSLIVNFITPDPVDTVGSYYRDQLGLPLRRVQGKGTMVWVGDIVYHNIPVHLAAFGKDGVTYIQMS
ncbi:hypothetical protein [Capsulimonas corticalis]|nr:hypothetical protein [Capsulimonas corticalis]